MRALLAEEEAAAFVERLARQLGREIPALSQEAAHQAADLAVTLLENELFAAGEYVRLRDAICATMADPDSWDGDEAEPELLVRYLKHMAQAIHGDCARCHRVIRAGERFERTPGCSVGIRLILCDRCI